jgi:hypothetical protein
MLATVVDPDEIWEESGGGLVAAEDVGDYFAFGVSCFRGVWGCGAGLGEFAVRLLLLLLLLLLGGGGGGRSFDGHIWGVWGCFGFVWDMGWVGLGCEMDCD